MLRNYLKIVLRNLIKNKVYSFINIGGLAVGLTVALLIGLWIYDELSYNTYHQKYDRIVEVLQQVQVGGGLETQYSLPMPLSSELRTRFGDDIEHISATFTYEQSIAYKDKALTQVGCYAESSFTGIITLEMVKGTREELKKPGSVLISESLAQALFGAEEPVGQVVKLNNAYTQLVVGVYKNQPKNNQFQDVQFIAPIGLLFSNAASINNWHSSSFHIYASLSPVTTPEKVSFKIANVLYEHTVDATKPKLLVNPMKNWHLYSFKKGVLTGGRIEFVWLFGIIGVFVLLLACINFMNLSTARSEKRAKEVGIRKAIGSVRTQLIGQFLSESLLITFFASLLSLLFVQVALPFFNELADKNIAVPWSDSWFLPTLVLYTVFTGLLAGSYPALYLSSFQPITVLKGMVRVGRSANIPRKALVVSQFTISSLLIIGTVIVYQQIQFAKNRPLGYNQTGIFSIPFLSSQSQYQAFRNAVLQSQTTIAIAAASNPATGIWSSADNLEWEGKDPNRQETFGTVLIEPDFEKVVEWKIKEGRSFSSQLASDSSGFVFNEAAIRQMGLENPVGKRVKWHDKNWTILGVVKDLVMTSPFEPSVPTVFLMNEKERSFNVINIKLRPGVSVADALQKIESIHKQFESDAPFNYKFADQEYALKFASEERTGKLASVFAGLAIFISCLGLFGLTSFVAEQRQKEIGIRKVLGATVVNLWTLLSKDFVILVLISCLLAIPIAWYAMNQWLHQYTYRITISGWMFAVVTLGVLLITLATVSFQALRAALSNPVQALRSE